jgi:Glycosyl transferase family 2
MSTPARKHQYHPIGKTHRVCPICGSAHLEYEFVVNRSPVCGCQECGLLFLNPQPVHDAACGIPRPEANGLDELLERNAAKRIEQLLAYSGIHTGNLLIVGGDAHLCAEARNAGFAVRAITTEEIPLLAASQPPASVDACICFCALERMTDPLSGLLTIRTVLKASGSLMVVSPTTDSTTARLFGTSWWEFNRTNLFYFSTDTLQNLLLMAGFGDPLTVPDHSVVSLNYLRQRLSGTPSDVRRYRLLRRAVSVTPLLRNKAFRLFHGRTSVFVKPKERHSIPLLSVIVPVYNECSTFVELIDQVLAKEIDGVDIEVIIVESNSTDGSRDLVLRYEQHPRVRVILEERARGKGHAVRAGLAVARGDIILFQDADLEYDINDYDALLAPLLRFQRNFVLGSRHGSEKATWKMRTFAGSPGMSALFNFGHVLFLTLFNVLYSQRLHDPFTMFKVFRRDCLYGLTFDCNRFDFDYEIVIKLLRKGYKPAELPINYKSRSLKEGKKVTVFRDPLTWIRALIRFRRSPLYADKRMV